MKTRYKWQKFDLLLQFLCAVSDLSIRQEREERQEYVAIVGFTVTS